MKLSFSKQKERGLTRTELLVVIVVITFFAIVFAAQPDRNAKKRAQRIQCINNLKIIGLSFRISPGGCDDRYLTQTSTNRGGSLEFASGPNAFRHFQVMSNELGTPRLLFCPSDAHRQQLWPTNWDQLSNSNLSYFVGIDAGETVPNGFLSGDRNVTNGAPLKNSILELTLDRPVGWTEELHHDAGNLLLADGSVQQRTTPGLDQALEQSGVDTNRLQMPVLGP